MTGNQWLDLLFSAGGAAIIVAMINAIQNRRKLSADAAQIISQAAAGTVENIMKDNAALREKQATMEAQIVRLTIAVEAAEKREKHTAVMEERYRWHLDRWHRYASRLADEMRAMGGTIEDPPPLWPEPMAVLGDDGIEL